MTRNKSWGQNKRSFIDKIIEYFRFMKIGKYIKKDIILLDLGCGFNGNLLHFYKNRIKFGIGVDIVVNKLKDKKIQLLKGNLSSPIKLLSNSFDCITLLAVIEHLNNSKIILKEAKRLLKKNGYLIISTPNSRWKPLLELMANLKIINEEEIKDHKQYYSAKSIYSCLSSLGFTNNKIKITSYPTSKIADFVILAVAQK